MNLILRIPLEARLGVVLVVGVVVGNLVNLAAVRLAWRPRSIGPRAQSQPGAPPRRWADRVPLVGWLRVRRAAGAEGGRLSLRPLLVDLLCGVGFAALYWWEVEAEGLLPRLPLAPADPTVLHLQFAAHVVLISLMLVASLIDMEQKIIPDAVTVPGTLAGLLLAAVVPWSLLPEVVQAPNGRAALEFMRLTSPNPWPPLLGGFPETNSLWIALGCWWLWCIALLPRSWHSRHGLARAVQLFCARLTREPATPQVLAMGVIGSAACVGVWFAAGVGWEGLLSALVGLAAGGGLVWMVRIVGTAALRREAMGFGDVTLMAMVGSFLGWQACLVVFFLAPFAGLLLGVLQLVLRRETEIPYGPFLCLAATAVIVLWAPIWDRVAHLFAVGWLVPLVLLICLALMAVMLAGWKLVVSAFVGRRAAS